MLTEILTRVRELDDKIRKTGSATWYRGHRKSEWLLKSTLHRHVERLTSELKLPPQELAKLFRDEAKTRYQVFKQEAWPLLRDTERSIWGVLFAMQHYRLPTRLLDWTESFMCALFFAQQDREPGDVAAIWALDSAAVNEISNVGNGVIQLDETAEEAEGDARAWHPRWEPPDEGLPTIAVAPIFTNPRMTAQRSAFTLAGDSFLPLDEQFDGRLIREGRLIKFELAADTFDEIQDYLRIMGIRAFTYFPDLEGLALDHEARTAARSGTRRSSSPNLLNC